jgi:hypothetical protein
LAARRLVVSIAVVVSIETAIAIFLFGKCTNLTSQTIVVYGQYFSF